ncbi:WD40-repeat-containing domain protein [Limtongia smithiae]|uniref:WD40-repeat-containing domain protein n=1 Tax=Limtongia smithiae TaxID=1125753 RepID=UPI0034CFBAAF
MEIDRNLRESSSGDTTDSDFPVALEVRTEGAAVELKAPSQQIPASTARQKDSPQYRLHFILEGHEAGITSIKFSADGQWIATASSDKTIKIWHATDGEYELTIEGHIRGINDIAWSLDSKVLASGSDDKTIKIWDALSGRVLRTLRGHTNYVYSVDFSPKGNLVASGSFDESVKIWDVRKGVCLRTLPAHSDPVSAVHFSRDGTMIVSSSHDGQIRLWDTASGQCLKTLIEDNNAPVSSVRFSPNGKFLLSGALDSSVRLWDYLKGKCVKTYLGHKNEKFICSSTFSTARAVLVASGSEDGQIFFWDVQTKDIVQVLDGHSDVVLCVDAHPTEAILASAGMDKTAKVWVYG